MFPTGFAKILIYQTYSVAKSANDSVAPAVIVVVSLRNIAEEQLRNSEFDLKVGPDNKSLRDPEISFNRIPRSVKTHGQFTEDLTTDRRRQWISAISRERVTLFFLHSTFRKVHLGTKTILQEQFFFHRVACSHKLILNVQISLGAKKVLFAVLYSSQTLFWDQNYFCRKHAKQDMNFQRVQYSPLVADDARAWNKSINHRSIILKNGCCQRTSQSLHESKAVSLSARLTAPAHSPQAYRARSVFCILPYGFSSKREAGRHPVLMWKPNSCDTKTRASLLQPAHYVSLTHNRGGTFSVYRKSPWCCQN